jgi:tetratricopeptide (TPR) repeat protein
MNGPVLALIVVAALIIAVLLLKRRTSQHESPRIEAIAPADTTTPATEPLPGEEPAAPAETPLVPVASEVLVSEKEPSPAATAEALMVAESEEAAVIPAEELMEPVGEAAAELEEVVPPVEENSLLTQEVEPAEEVVVFLEEESSQVAIPEELTVAELEEVAAMPAEALMEPVGETAAEPEEFGAVVPAFEEAITTHPVEPAPVVDAAVPMEEDVTVGVPRVGLTLEAYAVRLNALEEKQRAVLARAIGRRDDQKRDQLQRELVMMNDKLALLADSYLEETTCYQQILVALETLQVDDQARLATVREQLQGGEPQAAEDFLTELSGSRHSFAAQAAFHGGQLAECRVDLLKALELYRRAVELEAANPRYLRAAGKAARSLYRYQEALPWLETFVKLSGVQKDRDPVEQALAQRELAYTYVLSGQYQKAGPLYKESMTVLAQQLGQDHPEMATSWYQIGELQETLGEYDKAVSVYKKSLVILEQKRGAEHPALANILDKLAALCMELEMEKQAVPLYERLVRIREKALRPTHPQLALSLNNLAESYRLQGRYAEAEACYRKSLVINETLHGVEHPSVAAVLQELAKLCTSQRKSEEAQQYQQRASAIFQKSVEASEKRTGQDALTLEI